MRVVITARDSDGVEIMRFPHDMPHDLKPGDSLNLHVGRFIVNVTAVNFDPAEDVTVLDLRGE